MFRAKNKHKNNAKKTTILVGTSMLILALLAPVGLVLAVSVTGVERISVDSSGTEGDGDSYASSVSADGHYVAFGSDATNLISGDTNTNRDVFVYDTLTNAIERVSVDSSSTEANNASDSPSISADGRYVAFESNATNLISSDMNTATDVFVHDRQSGTTERVSVDSSGTEANNASANPSISADGRYVTFQSSATNLVSGDSNTTQDIFVHDRQSGTTERVNVDSSGTEANNASDSPSISANGRHVIFSSWASNLVSGDTNAQYDTFVHDRSTNTTERVSVDSSGLEGNSSSGSISSISADGRYVTFHSFATNLVDGDTNGRTDIFVRDRMIGTTERVSVDSSGTEGNAASNTPAISSGGRYVAFQSSATNLISGDSNAAWDIFVHDRSTGTTQRISVDSSSAQSNGDSTNSAISADGHHVVFQSGATNLVSGDSNGRQDIFLTTLTHVETSADTIESAGPNSGDANNDGTADTEQTSVASIVSSVSSDYVVVAADTNECLWADITNASVTTATATDADGYTYPAGLTTFTLQCGEVGSTVTITHYYYGDYNPDTLVLRKYNATTDTYATITDATLTAVTIGGQSALQVEYEVTDGGPLDEDGTANGVIIDPVGLALAVTGPADPNQLNLDQTDPDQVVGAPNTGLPQQSLIVTYSAIAAGLSLLGYAVIVWLWRRNRSDS